jgi:hypothetical protein
MTTLAHHLGENALPGLLSAAAAAGPALLVVLRVGLSRLVHRAVAAESDERTRST